MPIILKTLDFLLNPVVKYVGSKRFQMQEIATDVLITPDWAEFPIEPPVKIKKKVQHISLGIECYRDNHQKFYKIKSSDTILNAEIQIIDSFGNLYELRNTGMFGGFDKDNLDRQTASSLLFSSYPDKLPKDRVYTKIKIRNEQPFLCPRISWIDFDLK